MSSPNSNKDMLLLHEIAGCCSLVRFMTFIGLLESIGPELEANDFLLIIDLLEIKLRSFLQYDSSG
jgi:hypothetical protein